MSKEFQLISNVSPGSSGWTVKVVVAEKFSPRIAQKSPTKYQNLILMDTELSSKLCIPTDEKDFTEIKNIQGLKTMEKKIKGEDNEKIKKREGRQKMQKRNIGERKRDKESCIFMEFPSSFMNH
ncbi:hypothetical protein Fot_52002 [Forsythia ovata]|uniref:Uncharacterized protein n=1 Tax=Forsythia ovata TaxID=205694 RepID=A0ABD1PJF0_9LAMI